MTQHGDRIDFFDGTEHDFLSNFHPSEIRWSGGFWPTVEHAYQAAKVMDRAGSGAFEFKTIHDADTPGEAKRLGQCVMIRSDWEQRLHPYKVKIMKELLDLKFPGNVGTQELRRLSHSLVTTYPLTLVEGNTWRDMTWGVWNGAGMNLLGRLEMVRRGQLMGGPTGRREEAFHLGGLARAWYGATALGMDQNPYQPGTVPYRSWFAGWDAAEDDGELQAYDDLNGRAR
jgi:ribA/ribD-fused uncharacterized protein